MSNTKKKSKKRANGEGTFYQLADKTWVHQITVGRKPNGSPDRKTFSGKTRQVCIDRREAYKAEKAALEATLLTEKDLNQANEAEALRRGHSLASEICFNEAFLTWLKIFKSPPTKKTTTYSGYLDLFEDHFSVYFGEKMLWEISQEMIQEYYHSRQLEGARKDGKPGGLSAKTIKNHHMLLKDFFKYAMTKYELKSNPTLDTARPTVRMPKMRVLDTDEMVIFLREVLRETQRTAILFDLFTGLRIGELLALKVSDISPKTQTVEICRNITRVRTDAMDLLNPTITVLNYTPAKKTHLIVQDFPKTESSNTSVPLSDMLFELVAKHLFYLEQSGWPNPDNLLFPSTKGTHIDPRSYALRLKAISKRCEIKKVNPHALRHTFATRLVEQKTPLTTVMELMRHTSVATTQRYVASLTAEQRGAVKTLSEYWNPEALHDTEKLNGTRTRMKYSEVRLPSWLQNEPVR